MEFISFNNELGLANLMFQRPFSNIRIERTNKAGEKTLLRINCLFEQRSRIVKSLENPEKRGTMRLPMITIERTGYQRSGERLNSLHNEVKYEISPINRNYQLLTPVPIDINYTVNVIAKYPEDIDKIASNFMVFFNNDIYVTCEHPKYEGVKMNNQIVMSDSVSEEHPSELDNGQDDFIIASFQFTFKTYLFGGTAKAKKIKALSTYLSTVVSSYVKEMNTAEATEFIEQNPDATLCANVTSLVDTVLTAYDYDGTGDYYDNGIPPITKIDIGFYATPTDYDITSYMDLVDSESLTKHMHYYPSSYISSEQYVLSQSTYVDADGYPKYEYHGISSINDVYDSVDNYCTLAPYVDRMFWEITGASLDGRPNFVVRGCK